MSRLTEYFYFSVFTAAFLLSMMGLWFTAVIPGIDRWSKRFFLSYFTVFLLCCISTILEMLLYFYPVPIAVIYFVLILECLLLSVPLPMLTVYLLHCCGENTRRNRLMQAVSALWAVYFLLTGLEKEEPENWDYKKLALSLVFIFLALLIRLEMLSLLFVAFITLFLAHYEKGRDNNFKARFRIFFVCAAVLLISAAAIFGAVRVVKGQWDFARLDKIFSAQGMGEEKYDVADPLKPSAEIYDAHGKPIPMARTKYAFAHLAWDHQRALFGYEILYKTWKTLHPVGLALLLIALY